LALAWLVTLMNEWGVVTNATNFQEDMQNWCNSENTTAGGVYFLKWTQMMVARMNITLLESNLILWSITQILWSLIHWWFYIFYYLIHFSLPWIILNQNPNTTSVHL
jgi:hypothetical protein